MIFLLNTKLWVYRRTKTVKGRHKSQEGTIKEDGSRGYVILYYIKATRVGIAGTHAMTKLVVTLQNKLLP